MPTSVDRERHVVSVTDPYGRIFGFLDQERFRLPLINLRETGGSETLTNGEQKRS
jgi:hypothetical protein